MVCSKMLSEMNFAGECIYARVSCAMRTWELGGLVSVPPEIFESSIGFAARALEGSVVDGFGVTLELGT